MIPTSSPPRNANTLNSLGPPGGVFFFQPDATGLQPRQSLCRRVGPSRGVRWPWPTTRRRTDRPAAVLGRELPVRRRQSLLGHPPSDPATPPRVRSTAVPSGSRWRLAWVPEGRWDADAFLFPFPCSGPFALPTPEALP